MRRRRSKCCNNNYSVAKIIHAWTAHMSSSSVASRDTSSSSDGSLDTGTARVHTRTPQRTRIQQQVRECSMVRHIQVGHAGAHHSSPCPRGVNALRLDPSSRIPAANSTATARVSEPTASLNAPHMCSCCCAVSPAGVRCCMRWTIGWKCEANRGWRLLHFLDHTQGAEQASRSYNL